MLAIILLVCASSVYGQNYGFAPRAPAFRPMMPAFSPPAPAPGGYGGQPQPAQPGIQPQPPSISPPPPAPKLCDASATSEGMCSAIDENLWETTPQCALSKAIMFDRQPGLSCDECLLNCAFFQDENSPWICRAVTYDHRWQLCDLYAISGDGSNYPLVAYEGRDYFKVKDLDAVKALADDATRPGRRG